jgi:maltooligosyltrehalose trehalohydrolase
MKIGAIYRGNNTCDFIVWAVNPRSVAVKIVEPFEHVIEMEKDENNYWHVQIENIKPGTKYFYTLNHSDDRPDTASNYQPDGVHGASRVVDHSAYKWNDSDWKGVELKDLIIYELHIGTFTKEGTFNSAIDKLDEIKKLGITAIEIMPVSQFTGSRNWGYDGCYPFAVQNSYGGPEGLKNLVDAAHQKNMAVILDVVYNHFGPEGNYFSQYSPYFTHNYRTPWGDAINFDGLHCEGVRNYFIENARYWLRNFHFDGLRLDAIDTIYDNSKKHFLLELSEEVKKISAETGLNKFLIAESDLNDVKIINPKSKGGYDLDIQWSDDFHHSIHTLLTGEKLGYYVDFGSTEDLTKAINENFTYSGRYSVFRKREHGNSASGISPLKFIFCLQNHDQIGNRAFGERLSNLISFEALKVAAGILLLVPQIPMLFMGEEYGEKNSFLYFVDHSDEHLIKAVQEGRKKEFSSFSWKGVIPDPFDEETFLKSKLNHASKNEEKHKVLLYFYRDLIAFRKNSSALNNFKRESYQAVCGEKDKTILLSRQSSTQHLFCIFNFNEETITMPVDFPEGDWRKIFDSASEKWLGPGESTTSRVEGKLQNLTIRASSFTIYELE